MPTGGVSLDNMALWFEAGAAVVGVGGNLISPAKTGDFDKVTILAKQYRAKFNEIKGN
jgi:2-dehydro-3-deoxyphosphogluconate aldolase/(4S)-4-hydroxy-2-oxoglutarate aldolase